MTCNSSSTSIQNSYDIHLSLSSQNIALYCNCPSYIRQKLIEDVIALWWKNPRCINMHNSYEYTIRTVASCGWKSDNNMQQTDKTGPTAKCGFFLIFRHRHIFRFGAKTHIVNSLSNLYRKGSNSPTYIQDFLHIRLFLSRKCNFCSCFCSLKQKI